MKRGLLSFFVGAFLVSGGIDAQNVVNEVVGDYTGDLYVALDTEISDEIEPSHGQTVNLVAGSVENTVTLSLHNFSFGDTPVGDIEVPNVPVIEISKGFLFGENPAISLSLLGGSILATAQINTSESLIKGDSLIAKIDVVWTGMESQGNVIPMNTPINVLFKGKKEGGNSISNADVASSSSVFYNMQDNYLIMPIGEMYQIYNIAGYLVKSGRAGSDAISINDLCNGLYLVKVGKVTTKIVKR